MKKKATLLDQVRAVMDRYPKIANDTTLITKWLWRVYYPHYLRNTELGWTIPFDNFEKLPSQESIGRAMRQVRSESIK